MQSAFAKAYTCLFAQGTGCMGAEVLAAEGELERVVKRDVLFRNAELGKRCVAETDRQTDRQTERARASKRDKSADRES